MERITVPANKVMEALSAVVAEQPEYVYAAPEHMAGDRGLTCFYVHADADGTNARCGCLVGKVLNMLGVPLDLLSAHEGRGATLIADKALEIKGQPDEIADAMHTLAIAQDAQDHGAPWGVALALATRKPGE